MDQFTRFIGLFSLGLLAGVVIKLLFRGRRQFLPALWWVDWLLVVLIAAAVSAFIWNLEAAS